MSLEEFLDFLVQQKLLLDQDSNKKSTMRLIQKSFYAKNSLIPLKKGDHRRGVIVSTKTSKSDSPSVGRFFISKSGY